jgi:hypothetical protein
MKIILDFCGTSSTGKTTLIEALINSSDFPVGLSCKHVDSMSRSIGKTTVINENSESLTQYAISLHNFTNILHATISHDIVLCTDLGIRPFAYSIGKSNRDPVLEKLHDKVLQVLFSNCISNEMHFIFFYLPPEIPFVKDGIRQESPDYVKRIDDIILDIYKIYKIQYITLTGSVEERKTTVLDALNNRIKSFNPYPRIRKGLRMR